MKYYIVLGISILANVGANISIKTAMTRVGGMEITSLVDIWEKFILNYLVWLGIFLFGIALLSYSYVLSHIQLSIAYPIMTSLAFILVVLASLFYLDERLTVMQVGGILFVIIGVWLVAN